MGLAAAAAAGEDDSKDGRRDQGGGERAAGGVDPRGALAGGRRLPRIAALRDLDLSGRWRCAYLLGHGGQGYRALTGGRRKFATCAFFPRLRHLTKVEEPTYAPRAKADEPSGSPALAFFCPLLALASSVADTGKARSVFPTRSWRPDGTSRQAARPRQEGSRRHDG